MCFNSSKIAQIGAVLCPFSKTRNPKPESEYLPEMMFFFIDNSEFRNENPNRNPKRTSLKKNLCQCQNSSSISNIKIGNYSESYLYTTVKIQVRAANFRPFKIHGDILAADCIWKLIPSICSSHMRFGLFSTI